MATQYRLDDKYTSGVWYDTYNGDYCEIQRGFDPDACESGRVVELVNPENGDVYWDMPVSEWVESEQQDFRQVSEQAVNDPTEIVNRALRLMLRNDINELASVPTQEQIDIRYARQQVEIQEAD